MKKIKLFLIFCFLMLNITVKAQWFYAIYLDTYFGPFLPLGDLMDANFTSESSGMYSFSHYISPSSGSNLWVKSTQDSANTWSWVYSETAIGIGSYAIHAVRNQNTYYHIRNWQGFTIIDKSDDNGLNWHPAGGGCGYHQDFSAVDTSHYFYLYYDNACTFPGRYYISKYINGISLIKIDTFFTEYAHIMFFPDTLTGYIAASTQQNSNNHLILKSVTGGTNWSTVFSDSLINIRKMHFTSANIGYAIGDSGKAIKTIDGGMNWQYLTTGTSVNLNSVYFINDSVGFAAGDSGKILRTLNAGNTWYQDYTGTSTSFSKIFFVNDSVGFALALAAHSFYKTNLNFQTGIWEPYILNQSLLEIFPNPTIGAFNITVPNDFLLEKNLTLSIYDHKGILIQQIPVQMSEGKIKLNLEAEAKGVYNVTLSNGKKSYSGKIVFE